MHHNMGGQQDQCSAEGKVRTPSSAEGKVRTPSITPHKPMPAAMEKGQANMRCISGVPDLQHPEGHQQTLTLSLAASASATQHGATASRALE